MQFLILLLSNMIKFVCLLVVVSTTTAVLRTIVFSNHRYYGHLLTGSAAPGGNVTVTNPAVNINHKWTIDWDAAFGSNGSTIMWNGAQNSSLDSAGNALKIEGAANPPAATQLWKLTYTQSGSTYLYRIMVGTSCIRDVPSAQGFAPTLEVEANCTAFLNETYWNIYSG